MTNHQTQEAQEAPTMDQAFTLVREALLASRQAGYESARFTHNAISDDTEAREVLQAAKVREEEAVVAMWQALYDGLSRLSLPTRGGL